MDSDADTLEARATLAGTAGDLAKLSAQERMLRRARTDLAADHKAAGAKAAAGIDAMRGSTLEDEYLDQQNRAKGLES